MADPGKNGMCEHHLFPTPTDIIYKVSSKIRKYRDLRSDKVFNLESYGFFGGANLVKTP